VLTSRRLSFLTSPTATALAHPPEHFRRHRRNQPGVTYNDLNITGETLRTTQESGYALFDVNRALTGKIAEALRNVPGTVRVRILY